MDKKIIERTDTIKQVLSNSIDIIRQNYLEELEEELDKKQKLQSYLANTNLTELKIHYKEQRTN
jgi:hypothetical protein